MIRRFCVAVVLVATAAVSVQADIIAQWNFNRDGSGNLPSPPSSPPPSLGSGTASLVGGVLASGTGFASGTVNGGSSEGTSPPAGGPLGNNAWQINDGWSQTAPNMSQGVQFAVDTTGYQDDIIVKFDLRKSNTSSRFLAFQYTTNGTTWNTLTDPTRITIGTNPLGDGSGSVTSGGLIFRTFGDRWLNINTIDLTGLGVGNKPLFAIRMVAAHNPSTGQFVQTTSGNPPINPTGTWRFDMVTVEGSPIVIPEPSAAVLLSLVSLVVLGRRRRA